MNVKVSLPVKRDPGVQSLQESLEVYAKYAKHIIINGKNIEFEWTRDLAGDLARYIAQYRPLSKFQISEQVEKPCTKPLLKLN